MLTVTVTRGQGGTRWPRRSVSGCVARPWGACPCSTSSCSASPLHDRIPSGHPDPGGDDLDALTGLSGGCDHPEMPRAGGAGSPHSLRMRHSDWDGHGNGWPEGEYLSTSESASPQGGTDPGAPPWPPRARLPDDLSNHGQRVHERASADDHAVGQQQPVDGGEGQCCAANGPLMWISMKRASPSGLAGPGPSCLGRDPSPGHPARPADAAV